MRSTLVKYFVPNFIWYSKYSNQNSRSKWIMLLSQSLSTKRPHGPSPAAGGAPMASFSHKSRAWRETELPPYFHGPRAKPRRAGAGGVGSICRCWSGVHSEKNAYFVKYTFCLLWMTTTRMTRRMKGILRFSEDCIFRKREGDKKKAERKYDQEAVKYSLIWMSGDR